MSVEHVGYQTDGDIQLSENISWWDPNTQCAVVISQPATDPELWHRYLDAAQQSYRKHGVEAALDTDAIRRGDDTALFWTVFDRHGTLIGGVRAKGPIDGADDSHAAVEWEGQPGQAAVRKAIDDRTPFGIAEIKTAWSSDDRSRAHDVTGLLARAPIHSMTILGVQFSMATAAQHVLERWKTSGGVVAPIGATPYPDARYLTKMMWWDRRMVAKHGEPAQISKALHEVDRISAMLAAS
jgi:hypothetical protein